MPAPIKTEVHELFRSLTLNAGAPTTISKELQLGGGWSAMRLRFGIALTIGSGSGAISEGELQIIKNIFLKTSKGEIIANCPGRLLYRMAQAKYGTLPAKDAIAAASATYYVDIPISFVDPRLMPGHDWATVLNTDRYESLTLQVTMGTVADLLTTVTGASIALTLDCEVERTDGPLPAEMYPTGHVQYGVAAPADPTTTLRIALEKATDLAYKRLLVFGSTGSSAGTPFTGTSSNACITDLDVDGSDKMHARNRLQGQLQADNKISYQLETSPTGCAWLDFVARTRSNESVLLGAQGGRPLSRLDVVFRAGASLPATPQVSVGYEGICPLK